MKQNDFGKLRRHILCVIFFCIFYGCARVHQGPGMQNIRHEEQMKKNSHLFRLCIRIGLGMGLILIPSLFSGCASALRPMPTLSAASPAKEGKKPHAPKMPPNYYSGTSRPRPYKIGNQWYQPLVHAEGFRQRGIASWYGADFHGKPTSSGELYDMHGISAAHKILPLHTNVRVRNLENGKSIVLRINDRGPFIPGRIIDLSVGAAQQLGIYGPGTAQVEIEALGIARPASAPKKDRPVYASASYDKGNYSIQVGAFGDRENAEKLARELGRAYKYAQIKSAYCPHNRQTLYRVLVGKCSSLEQAELYEKILKLKGFDNVFTIAE